MLLTLGSNISSHGLLVTGCWPNLHISAGYENTFVCEPDHDKALQMYKDWKAGKKPEASAAHAAAGH